MDPPAAAAAYPPPPRSIGDQIADEQSTIALIDEMLLPALTISEESIAQDVAVLEAKVNLLQDIRNQVPVMKEGIEYWYDKGGPKYIPPPRAANGGSASILTRVVNVWAVCSLGLRRAAANGITSATNGITIATDGVLFIYDKAYKVLNVASAIKGCFDEFFRRS